MSPQSTVSGIWALITGVSEGGLGYALLIELMKRNINVIATAQKLEMLDYLRPPNNFELEKLQVDVTDASSISAAATEAERITAGKLDYLFNNAGYGYMMPLLSSSVDEVKKNFDVNVFGLLAVTQAFFPLLQAAKGKAINQCSIAGLSATYKPFIGSYTASKSAVMKLSDTLRVELAPFDINVVTLVMGDVRTHFWDNAAGAHVGLPDDSPYQPIRDKAEAAMRGQNNPADQHSHDRWAKEAVGDLLRSNPPRYIRRGFLAKTMWIVGCMFPFWLLDWMYAQVSGFSKLKGMVPQHDQKKMQ